ncbi:hypothetical protein CSC17_1310 [Klebsiella oxytoca]|nr:hypothetical protein CSC17_1310 [Klebsiella oxytoca]
MINCKFFSQYQLYIGFRFKNTSFIFFISTGVPLIFSLSQLQIIVQPIAGITAYSFDQISLQ